MLLCDRSWVQDGTWLCCILAAANMQLQHLQQSQFNGTGGFDTQTLVPTVSNAQATHTLTLACVLKLVHTYVRYRRVLGL